MDATLEAAIRALLPWAEFDHDNEGQIVIYTGIMEEERA